MLEAEKRGDDLTFGTDKKKGGSRSPFFLRRFSSPAASSLGRGRPNGETCWRRPPTIAAGHGGETTLWGGKETSTDAKKPEEGETGEGSRGKARKMAGKQRAGWGIISQL